MDKLEMHCLERLQGTIWWVINVMISAGKGRGTTDTTAEEK
jgi:hypothetical protein